MFKTVRPLTHCPVVLGVYDGNNTERRMVSMTAASMLMTKTMKMMSWGPIGCGLATFSSASELLVVLSFSHRAKRSRFSALVHGNRIEQFILASIQASIGVPSMHPSNHQSIHACIRLSDQAPIHESIHSCIYK